MVAKIHQKIAEIVTSFMDIKNASSQRTCAQKKTEVTQLTLIKYQELASRTIAKNMTSQDCEMHALHGMVGEIGELHSIYQKIYQGHMQDPVHQKKELGDLLWFAAEYATSKGWTLEDVAQTNINKLMERYPEGFEAERSLHRKEGDI